MSNCASLGCISVFVLYRDGETSSVSMGVAAIGRRYGPTHEQPANRPHPAAPGAYEKENSDLYTGFGMTHSGRMRREGTDSVFTPLFAEFPEILPDQQSIDEMAAFVRAFPGDAHPVTGWQVRPDAPMPQDVRDDLLLMMNLHGAGEATVFAHGLVNGTRTSLVVIDANDGDTLFQADSGLTFTLDALLAGIDLGDDLFFLAAPGRFAGFFDDVEGANRGWVTNPDGTDTATTGQWQIGNPELTVSDQTGLPIQPEGAASGALALITDPDGTDLGCCDVDGGITTVRSPAFELPFGTSITLSLEIFFAHTLNADSTDFFRLTVETDVGDDVVFERFGLVGLERIGAWEPIEVDLSAFAGETITSASQSQRDPRLSRGAPKTSNRSSPS